MPGRITSWKGHELAIKALHLLNDRNTKLIILGDKQKRVKYSNKLLKLTFGGDE